LLFYFTNARSSKLISSVHRTRQSTSRPPLSLNRAEVACQCSYYSC
jgi:hypothetical protein